MFVDQIEMDMLILKAAFEQAPFVQSTILYAIVVSSPLVLRNHSEFHCGSGSGLSAEEFM